MQLYLGDCLDVLRTLPDSSVDSVVTDPPYGLSFMGRKWDYDVPRVEIWAECLRVLKPGGHLLAFAGTRTQHRMCVRIEDAGFEIRDMIAWVYGSGFPKNLDISKEIDKAAGAEREVIGVREYAGGHVQKSSAGKLAPPIGTFARTQDGRIKTAPATDDAKQWDGWGTALKPALEPITLARKPLIGTVAANVVEHGTGGLNIDGCRVGGESTRRNNTAEMGYHGGNLADSHQTGSDAGRWPANLIHDGSDEVLAAFPNAPGRMAKASTSDTQRAGQNTYGTMVRGSNGSEPRDDSGRAARFFYCAKASKRDREDGNVHPTVKPTDLMRYLCRLVTPPGGVVLDPFAGSGSTGKGALLEGFQFIGIERELEYWLIAHARLSSIDTSVSTG